MHQAGPEKAARRDADARRTELRRLCRPTPDGPQPLGVDVLGWLMTGLGLLATGACLVYLVLALYQVRMGRPMAGEHLLGSALGLVYSLFFACVWHGFRTLPDWRVGLHIPLRTKFYAAAGSASCASLAAGSVVLLLYAICAKQTFLRFLERIGAAEVSKAQFIFSSLVASFFFLLLWYLFQGLMELRDPMRTALSIVFDGVIVLAVAGVLVDYYVLAGLLGNRGITVMCGALGGLSVVWFVWGWMAAGGRRALECFRADEF